MKKTFLKVILVCTLIGSFIFLNAKENEKFILILKESNIDGKILYEKKKNFLLMNLKLEQI